VLARHTGRIRRVEVRDKGVLHGANAARFARALRGRRFLPPRRHGKWLIARTDGRAIVLFHFGMTGALHWRAAGEAAAPYDRVVFALEGGELRYNDLRKLQGLWLERDEAAVERRLARLGPDALQIDREAFDRALERRGKLKTVLADQSVIAGLGNLLVDEICWRARIHPLRPSRGLNAAERGRLYQHMRRVLRAAIPTGRVPPRASWLTGQRDKPRGMCPRCGRVLSRRRVGGRTTVWCARCQARGASRS
jgi:formamidopyrimidine-DNA glycosylase